MIKVKELKRLCNTGAVSVSGKSALTFNAFKDYVIDMIKDRRTKESVADNDYSAIVKDTISRAVIDKSPVVEGYISNNNAILSEKLIKDLEDSILGWGKLTCCKDDDSISEIQINGRAIFVDTENGYELLREPTVNGKLGKPITFDSPEEAESFISNLLIFSGQRLKQDSTQVNGRTVEGFRIAATHSIINPPNKKNPTLKWVTALIRKHPEEFNEDDFLKRNSTCAESIPLIKASAKAKLPFAVVGTTGCGKTTTMTMYLKNLDYSTRLGCIQKPTEYMNEVEVEDFVINNAFYWEASDTADPDDPNSPTQDHLVDHSLRYTADLLFLGELRASNDFASASRASNTGTDWATTFHSFSIVAGLDRFALELCIYLGIDMDSAKELSARYLCLMAYQDRLGDGTRKIIEYAEVRGYDRVKREYNINYLYKFKATTVKYTAEGKPKIEGKFLKVGNISDELQQKFLFRGVGKRFTSDFLYEFKPTNGEEGLILSEVMYADLEE